jgi:hypothetical protein
MPFVDLLHFKNNSTDYMSQKMAGKSAEKNQKNLKFGEKVPKSREKLPGFSNPKSNLPLVRASFV